ncbi:unnamed protein product [Coregonus sp. 'balchen']|nr:unnamed protein product [Coregonus sp. 'balchen']
MLDSTVSKAAIGQALPAPKAAIGQALPAPKAAIGQALPAPKTALGQAVPAPKTAIGQTFTAVLTRMAIMLTLLVSPVCRYTQFLSEFPDSNCAPPLSSPVGTTRQPKEGEVPGVDYNFVTVDRFMELEKSGALLESGTYEENYYGTPKPPCEPSPLLLNVTDQLLPGARPSSKGKRKRNKSVSNMEKAGIEPPEDEEEERPVVNGNGNGITPESSEHEDKSTDVSSGDVPPQTCPSTETPTTPNNEGPQEEGGELAKSPPKPDENESELGPLPDNWEMAYTEKGEVYFIE